MLSTTTRRITVPPDDAYEAGYRAAIENRPRLFGGSRAGARDFEKGYALGVQERQAIAAAQARQARAAAVDSWIHGALAGRRSGSGLVGAADPMSAQAYAAGFRAMRSGAVLRDRGINWKAGWGVRPLTTSPSEIREMARALDETDEAPLERGELLARVYGGPPVHIKQ